jgi:uncharacterized membrane protein
MIHIDEETYAVYRPDTHAYAVFFFAGSTDGARALLGMVAGAAISVVTLTFSLTVLSLQMAASTYSPRILDEFLKDPVQKLTLSTYLGTFAYCFVVLVNVQSEMGQYPSFIPIVAVNFLIVHVSTMLLVFVLFFALFHLEHARGERTSASTRFGTERVGDLSRNGGG